MSVSGRPPGRAHPDLGGLALEKDGITQATKAPELDFVQTAGVISVAVADDVPNDRNDVTFVGDGMRMLAERVSINAKSVANTLLYTVPGGSSLLVEAVILRCVAASLITGPARGGVGANGGADDVYSSRLLTGLVDSGLYYLFPQGGISKVVPAGPLYVGIDAVAVGTSQTLEADLIGRLF